MGRRWDDPSHRALGGLRTIRSTRRGICPAGLLTVGTKALYQLLQLPARLKGSETRPCGAPNLVWQSDSQVVS